MLSAPLALQAQTHGAEQETFTQWLESGGFRYRLQTGVDSWDLRPTVTENQLDNLYINESLYLANSSNADNYRNPAQWLTFQSSLRVAKDAQVSIKFQTGQTGGQLDELVMDKAWNGLGVRVGLVDPRLSWCRSYDVESAWVREADVYCSDTIIQRSVRSVPGAQLYTDMQVSSLRVHTLIGYSSPLLMNYEPREFTGTFIGDLSKVTRNDRYSFAVNATHLESGLDFRLSYARVEQYADMRYGLQYPTMRFYQRADSIYAGVSLSPHPLWNIRLTAYRSDLAGRAYYPPGYERPDDRTPEVNYQETTPRRSAMMELNYQASPRDVVSVAHAQYGFNKDHTDYRLEPPDLQLHSLDYPGWFTTFNTTTSLSWRRNWIRGFYTILQFTTSHTDRSSNNGTGRGMVQEHAEGTALGLRMAYRW